MMETENYWTMDERRYGRTGRGRRRRRDRHDWTSSQAFRYGIGAEILLAGLASPISGHTYLPAGDRNTHLFMNRWKGVASSA